MKVEFSETVLKAFLREEERQHRQIGQWCRYAKAELSEMVHKALAELGPKRWTAEDWVNDWEKEWK